MLQIVKCPKHQKALVFYKDTPTHKLFKCPAPNCVYIDEPGVVHHDLPEKYTELQAENKQLRIDKENMTYERDRWCEETDGLQKAITQAAKQFDKVMGEPASRLRGQKLGGIINRLTQALAGDNP